MRRPIAITLILAFLLALVAPVPASWACPDGTPCVHDPVEGYVCPGNQCAAKASCCQAKSVRCKHGAVPAFNSAAEGRPGIASPDHCRYTVFSGPELTARAESKASLLSFGVDAVLLSGSPEFSLPQCSPVWRAEFTLGYRPPPLLSLGPSRAPPIA